MPKPPNPPFAAAAPAILRGRRTPNGASSTARSAANSCRCARRSRPVGAAPGSAECTALFRGLKNPWYIGDNVALTQTSGWVDAWTSTPSAYAVAARNTADVAAAVNFARTHRLRLAVKGGGHSYQGTSNAPDSLLVWTRKMDRIELHDGFVGAGLQGCAAAGGVGRRRRGVAESL